MNAPDSAIDRRKATRPARRRPASALLALSALLVSDLALAIEAPPQLNDFQILTPTVNSSASPANVQFTASISDAAPGVCTDACDDFGGPSQLWLRHPATGQRYAVLFEPVSGSDYAAAIKLPVTSAGGTWEVESIWLADRAGNRQVLSKAAIATAGFATELRNDSTTGDQTAPALTTVAVTPRAFDATAGQIVTVQLSISESGSGLCASGCKGTGGPSQVRFVSATTGQVRDGLIKLSAGSNYTANVDFPAGSATGPWTVESLRLVDLAGNRATFDQTALVGLGFATDLAVTSSTADEIPPRLVDSSSVPDPIDTTAAGLTASYTAVAEDASSGLCLDVCDDFGTSSQVLYRRTGSNQIRFGRLELLSGSPTSGSFDALVDIPVAGSPGVWRPERVLLADVAGNRVFVPEPDGGRSVAWIAMLALGVLGAARGGRTRKSQGRRQAD